MFKRLRQLLIRVGLLLVAIILGLGYMGLIPVVSSWFGSNHPVDFGLAATNDDRVRANEKFKQVVVNHPNEAGIEIIRSGTINTIDTTLTPQEAAAHLMQIHPFTDLQIRLKADGIFEASGKIDTPRIKRYLAAFDLTSVTGVDVLTTIDRYLTGQPTIYLRGTGSVADDQATIHLTSVKIGRIPLAAEPFAKGLEAYVEAVMKHVPGLDVTSLTIDYQMAHFVGRVPALLPAY